MYDVTFIVSFHINIYAQHIINYCFFSHWPRFSAQYTVSSPASERLFQHSLALVNSTSFFESKSKQTLLNFPTSFFVSLARSTTTRQSRTSNKGDLLITIG